jgi:hypothetical protein
MSSMKGTNIHTHILSQLDDLDTAHETNKSDYFSRGLPFYTCVDSAADLWTKETSDGKRILVERHFDFDKDEIVETFIQNLG